MIVLGIGGGLARPHDEDVYALRSHDAAAVIVRDGRLVAALEEERLDRLKHSSCFPLNAIRRSLDIAGVTLAEVDAVAINGLASTFQWETLQRSLDDARRPVPVDGMSVLAGLFERHFDQDVRSRLHFCHHHHAHGWSAFACSGYPEALVLSIDGRGDDAAGMVFRADGRTLTTLRRIEVAESLGFFYLRTITLLGLHAYDEYKAMGLAPYGDPDRFDRLFRRMYRLRPDGRYELATLPIWLNAMHKAGLTRLARRADDDFSQVHKDVAAALQRMLEEIILHVLRHFAKESGSRNLCLAGGVAHNCSMNGRILREGLFDRVFVQPASHDAGGALGAALAVWFTESPAAASVALAHVYLGPDVGDDEAIESSLRDWADQLEFERRPDIAEDAAALLANGAAIGWVQGRSEFGPRALGNRSILADPRPAANKDRINALIKKREGFRPFAPSVLEERAADFFDVPATQADLSFMTYVLSVKPAVREQLGAVTHVDGSARVQTVSRATNPRYWRLIDAFGRLTGTPVLLNTSFNNHAEPIVDSIDDAVSCFLTTGLDCLVVGDFLVRRKPVPDKALGSLIVALPPSSRVESTMSGDGQTRQWSIGSVKALLLQRKQMAISPAMFHALGVCDGRTPLRDLVRQVPPDCLTSEADIAAEALDLWSARFIRLRPSARTRAAVGEARQPVAALSRPA